MKFLINILILLIFVSCTKENFKTGDVIFQDSQSSQGTAIKAATHSKITHCGIIIERKKGLFVLEAVQPVKFTPLNQWIKSGKDNKYSVMRLKNSSKFSKSIFSKAQKEINKLVNKKYDIYFNWSDKEIYCSELVWKLYKRVLNVELCNLKKMKDYDLTNPEVKRIMNKRYGNNLPLNEPMVAPSDLMESKLLKTVYSNL